MALRRCSMASEGRPSSLASMPALACASKLCGSKASARLYATAACAGLPMSASTFPRQSSAGMKSGCFSRARLQKACASAKSSRPAASVAASVSAAALLRGPIPFILLCYP